MGHNSVHDSAHIDLLASEGIGTWAKSMRWAVEES
jgi:hypothetical protein